ncbi:MAG: RidA family protein [Spirochaetales bacterium]|nr:RidA family protein [Spirochaetales bacterium]
MARKAFSAKDIPVAGPYSQAVEAGGFVYLSGQLPIVPSTGKLVEGCVACQTTQCFANIKAVLEAAGLGFDDVVKATVFLRDMADFPAMNEVYREQFSAPYPARSTIGILALPLDARVEIELIAKRP